MDDAARDDLVPRACRAVTAYLKRGPFTVRWRHLPARANGQLAVGCYAWDAERGDYAAEVLDVLTVQRRPDRRGDRLHRSAAVRPLRPPRADRGVMPEAAPTRCVTVSVAIDRPAAEVHAFLADAANWPRWAITNVLAVEPGAEPGWWRSQRRRGRPRSASARTLTTGVVDHDFRDADGTWAVPARVVANGRGAEFSMTLFQPAEIDDAEFDRRARPRSRSSSPRSSGCWRAASSARRTA